MIWKDVVGYEGLYEVSDLGNVRSLNYNKTGRIQELAYYINKSGYIVATLHNKGKQKGEYVHRLVLKAFEGVQDDLECCHNDGDPSNNNISNLRWDTHRNNNLDKRNHGTHNNHWIINKSIIAVVKLLTRSGHKQNDVSGRFGISKTHVYNIKVGYRCA